MERSLQPTFSLDSGTRQETLLCLSRNSWNCCSLMTNLSASLRASSPAFSPSISRHWNTWSTFRGGECVCVSRCPRCKRAAHCRYLPADRAELGDTLCHVLVHVEGVDDRVELERHLVLLAPVADLVEVVEVALPALSPADQLVGRFVETVTWDGQNVQMVAWWREGESLECNTGATWGHSSSSLIKKCALWICPTKWALICSLTVFLEPPLFNHASVADNADARELQVLFAELNQLPQKVSLLVQKRLSTREIDLLHAWKNTAMNLTACCFQYVYWTQAQNPGSWILPEQLDTTSPTNTVLFTSYRLWFSIHFHSLKKLEFRIENALFLKTNKQKRHKKLFSKCTDFYLFK